MDVVADGIDFDKKRIVVFENTRDVGVELAAFLLAEQRASLLRAEHEVNDDVCKGLGHWSDALTGLRLFVRLTWASARGARSSPGYHIGGFQPRLGGHGVAREFKQAAEGLSHGGGRLCMHLLKPLSIITQMLD